MKGKAVTGFIEIRTTKIMVLKNLLVILIGISGKLATESGHTARLQLQPTKVCLCLIP